MIRAVGQSHRGNTFRQLQVGDVDDLAQFQIRQVHVGGGRQVGGETADFQVRDVVCNDTALESNAFTLVFVLQVYRHAGLHHLRVADRAEHHTSDPPSPPHDALPI